MGETSVINRWNGIVIDYHRWRTTTTYVNKALLMFSFTLLTAMGAFMRIYTPFTPVPFTAQTFFVLLAGVVVGRYWGAGSQIAYIAIGMAGVPWFAGGAGGVDYVFGATGGYLLGFVVAAFFLGEIVDTRPVARERQSLFGLMMVTSLIILTFGTIGLMLLGLSPARAVLFGFLPFVAVEAFKAVIASGVAVGITSRTGY